MSLKLQTPTSFPAFPFEPYGIQLDLMRHLYASIENKKITVAESPTGTGKTLSLLCASLTWLRDEQERARKGKLDELAKGDDGPDWVLAQTIDRRRRELEADDRERAERLTRARKKEMEMRKLANARVHKRKKLESAIEILEDDGDDVFLPDGDSVDDEQSNLSPAVLALMQKLLKGNGQANGDNDSEQEPPCTKIYYASRTHSQLAQVLHELRKLRLSLNVTTVAPSLNTPSSSSPNVGEKRSLSLDQEDEMGECPQTIRTVSLGSRKQLCINEDLRKRATDLDEACRQMLSEKGRKRCCYLPPPEEDVRMLDLRDQILAIPKDIEDLVTAGQNAEICPYFGSRRAIPQAQLVLLPYNLLLQKTAREALGIDLTDQVVVIDEAHNLISTLLSLSTTRLPLRTLANARQQLHLYLTKFRNRLTTEHSLHLTRLVGLLDALQKYCEEWRDAQTHGNGHSANQEKPQKADRPHAGGQGPGVEVMTPGELLRRLGRKTEGVNLLEIETYLRGSKIARKISGYSVKALEKAAGEDPVKRAKLARLASTTPPLHAVENFIMALTSPNDDGRVSLSLVDAQVEIKYQHLNPSTHFQEVVDAARSLVLAGGTMSPISDVVNQLFTNLPSDKLTTFSCGHIIPPDNLQTLVVKKGPQGSDLLLKYDQRGNQSIIAELGQILLNFTRIIPAGMVVFLPSYSFLNVLQNDWGKSGLMAKLRAKKKVFMEPPDNAQVETVLREYSTEIQKTSSDSATPGDPSAKGGALLFAVIGAKLSEGLNFSDDLARAVVIIGLPFANLASPELRERMNYVKRLQEHRSKGSCSTESGTKDAATELYENMCMNAVNQSIGRAIRHRGDWASLILIDSRYTSPRIRGKLPKWIGQDVIIAEAFGQAIKDVSRFYRDKRNKI